MIYIIIGCLAFVFMVIYDLNRIHNIHKNLNRCFTVGVVLLIAATLGILWGNYRDFEFAAGFVWMFGLIAVTALLLMLYALFFALPFSKTYKTPKHDKLVDTGMYALCRKPAVLWFFFFYFFLGLATGKVMVIWAAFIWTVINILYAYWHDRWLLPMIIIGYQQYRQQVPFLIPNYVSIRRCFATLR